MAKNIFEIGIFDESKSFVTTYTNEIFAKEFLKIALLVRLLTVAEIEYVSRVYFSFSKSDLKILIFFV